MEIISWYYRLTIGLLAAIMLMVVGVMLSARRERLDPFSAYADLFGEDAGQVALARGFICEEVSLGSHRQAEDYYCAQPSPEKIFNGQYLRISGSKKHELIFSLKENAVTLGDLVILWGRPDIWLYCQTAVASWPDRHIMSLIGPPQTGHISYFSPVISVSFTRNTSPYWEYTLMNDVLHYCGRVKADSLGS